MKIGLIDSGLGGLTVLKRLLNECPNNEYIYFGDAIHMPYGEKSIEEVISYGNEIIKFLESKNVDLIIIACGTLSSYKEYLESNVKLIDILSPMNEKLDYYKKVSVIATPLSIKRNAFKNYINTELNLISAPKLAPIIESGEFTELDEALDEYLESTHDSDALLLGCTHYPIIIDYIKEKYFGDIICMDEFIPNIINNYPAGVNSLKIYFSKLNEQIIDFIESILKEENIDIERMCLND